MLQGPVFLVEVGIDAGQAELGPGVQGLYPYGRFKSRAGAVIVGLVEAQPAQLGIDVGVLRVAFEGPHQGAGGVMVAARLLKAGRGVEKGAGIIRGGGGEGQIGGSGQRQVPFKVKFIGRRRAIAASGLQQEE